MLTGQSGEFGRGQAQLLMSDSLSILNADVLDDEDGRRLINCHPMTATHVLHFETSIASSIDLRFRWQVRVPAHSSDG